MISLLLSDGSIWQAQHIKFKHNFCTEGICFGHQRPHSFDLYNLSNDVSGLNQFMMYCCICSPKTLFAGLIHWTLPTNQPFTIPFTSEWLTELGNVLRNDCVPLRAAVSCKPHSSNNALCLYPERGCLPAGNNPLPLPTFRSLHEIVSNLNITCTVCELKMTCGDLKCAVHDDG